MKFRELPEEVRGLLVASFVNRCGTLGLYLLPMLLIERQFTSAQSGTILSTTKIFQPLSFILGGVAVHRFGARRVVLGGFLLTAVGLFLMPVFSNFFLILIASAIAQIGTSSFNPAARDLIRRGAQLGEIKVRLAWLRSVNNVAQMVSSALGIAAGGLGLLFPFLFDGITSLLAFFYGKRRISAAPDRVEVADESSQSSEPLRAKRAGRSEAGFWRFSWTLMAFYFLYDLGFLGFSALAKLRLGENAIQIFGLVSLINTAFCGLLAVPVSKYVTRPFATMLGGSSLVALGAAGAVVWGYSAWSFAFWAAVFSAGELLTQAFSQTLLLGNSPASGASRSYGASLAIQGGGRLLAGAALFPLYVDFQFPVLTVAIGYAVMLVLMNFVPRAFFERVHG